MTVEEYIKLGYAWTTETTVSDPRGQSRVVSPASPRPDASNHVHDRMGESLRMYDTTDIDGNNHKLETELAINTFMAGGIDEALRFNRELEGLFLKKNTRCLPRPVMEAEMNAKGFKDDQIDIPLSWLIKEGFIALDSDGDKQILKRLRDIC